MNYRNTRGTACGYASKLAGSGDNGAVDCSGSSVAVGFRLACDDEFQRYTGSSHVRSAEWARYSHKGGPVHPLTKAVAAGFRLALDTEEA